MERIDICSLVSNILKFTIFLCILASTTHALDDLISARCQAKCLREYELRVKNQTDVRRQLRHEILTFCRDDTNCSSCLLPCNENFETDQRCSLTVCKSAPVSRPCEDSCVFLEKVSRRKPGQCSAQSDNLVASECSATCNKDSDCKEAERCCTQGCSRACMQPTFPDDNRLLPIPEGISVQERKRKRSAVIRWVMKKMLPAHTATNSNLYVIQWRWGIQKDPETMTPWQTIVIKNKMYAILKHVLSSGRYYIFRVASVNTHGSAGFSKPSIPFKLTKEVRAPGPPQNLTIEQEQFDSTNKLWTIQMTWNPPASELPLRDYVLTWWKSSLDGVELYERQMGQKAALVQRNDDTDEEDEDSEQQHAGSTQERRSTILPSYSTRASLSEGLQPGNVYVIELYANVDSTEGELRGESTIYVLRTRTSPLELPSSNPTLPSLPPSSYYDTNEVKPQKPKEKAIELSQNDDKKSIIDLREQPNRTIGQKVVNSHDFDKNLESKNEKSDDSTIFRADIQPAYLERSNLKTTLSWLDHPKCSSERRDFNVRLQSVRCNRQTSVEQLVSQCVAPLEQLYFSCEYLVEVRDTGDSQLITRLAFSTAPCSRTPSSDKQKIDCKQHDEVPTLRCLPLNSRESGVECEWHALVVGSEEIVGFRTELSSSRAQNANVSIVAGAVRTIKYERLEDGTDYRLKVQALTANGLGQEVETEFRTGAAGSFLQEIDRRNTMKLPFEASYSLASPVNINVFNICLLLLFLFLRRIFV